MNNAFSKPPIDFNDSIPNALAQRTTSASVRFMSPALMMLTAVEPTASLLDRHRLFGWFVPVVVEPPIDVCLDEG